MARFRQDSVEKFESCAEPQYRARGAAGTQMLTRVQTMGPKDASAHSLPTLENAGFDSFGTKSPCRARRQTSVNWSRSAVPI